MKALLGILVALSLVSVSPARPTSSALKTSDVALEALSPADSMTMLAAIPRTTGTWRGSIRIPGVHTQAVTLTITSQTSKGKIKGILIANADPSIRVSTNGTVKSNRSFTITLAGGHSGGAINGTGSGKLSANKKSITFNMVFVQGGRNFAGTLTLTTA